MNVNFPNNNNALPQPILGRVRDAVAERADRFLRFMHRHPLVFIAPTAGAAAFTANPLINRASRFVLRSTAKQAFESAFRKGDKDTCYAILEDGSLAQHRPYLLDKLYTTLRRHDRDFALAILAALPDEVLTLTNPQEFDNTPLHSALFYGHGDVACAIIPRLPQAALNVRNSFNPLSRNRESGETPLRLALRENCLHAAKLLIHRLSPTAVNEKDDLGATFLHEATARSSPNLSLINALIEKLEGDEALNSPNLLGKTPLHYLCKHFSYVATINPDASNEALAPYLETIELLIGKLSKEAQATVTLPFCFGNSLLELAAERRQLAAVQAFIKKVPLEKLFTANNSGETPLHLAAKAGQIDVVRYLCKEAGLSSEQINARDNNGQTALHYASAGGHTEIIRFLLGRTA